MITPSAYNIEFGGASKYLNNAPMEVSYAQYSNEIVTYLQRVLATTWFVEPSRLYWSRWKKFFDLVLSSNPRKR